MHYINEHTDIHDLFDIFATQNYRQYM